MSDQRDQPQNLATPARIRAAQKAGQIPISRELANGLMWLGGLAILISLGGGMWQSLQEMAASSWSGTDTSQAADELMLAQFSMARSLFWKNIAPVLAAIATIAALSLAVQTRFGFFPEILRPKFSRISPAQNLRQHFSLPGFLNVAVGLLKLTGLMAIAWWILADNVPQLLKLSGLELGQGFGNAGVYLAGALVKLSAAVCVVGMADYGIRWWHNRRQLQMTDQEVRDEQRATEAPPEIDARRRLIHRRD